MGKRLHHSAPCKTVGNASNILNCGDFFVVWKRPWPYKQANVGLIFQFFSRFALLRRSGDFRAGKRGQWWILGFDPWTVLGVPACMHVSWHVHVERRKPPQIRIGKGGFPIRKGGVSGSDTRGVSDSAKPDGEGFQGFPTGVSGFSKATY